MSKAECLEIVRALLLAKNTEQFPHLQKEVEILLDHFNKLYGELE
jgi:hypothetical protein